MHLRLPGPDSELQFARATPRSPSAANAGLPELKDEIAKFYDGLSTDHVIVTSGGSEAIFSIYAALMKPGDHMVCETPNYPSNYGIPQGLGQDVTLCSMDFEDDYRLNLDKIKSMVQPNTKVLSICHPNNPTGCCITVEELQNLVDFCREKDIYLLSDETYREMYLEDPPPAACTLYDKAISITSMSKCYGIPGCRIGWLACKDQHLLDEVLTVREYVSITNNSVGEVLATEVLKRGEEMMAEHREHIAINKAIVCEWVDNHEHIEWVYPEVGVVGFPRLKDHVVEALDHPNDLFVLLADKYRTFTVPGGMMDCDPRHFRVGFGAFPEELKQGLQNFDDALAELL